MLSTEATIAMLALITITSLFISIGTEQNQKATETMEKATALAEAQKCALIIDSVFSNAAIPEQASSNCYQEEKGSVKAKNQNQKASVAIVAPSVFLNQQGGSATIEVKANAHYK